MNSNDFILKAQSHSGLSFNDSKLMQIFASRVKFGEISVEDALNDFMWMQHNIYNLKKEVRTCEWW